MNENDITALIYALLDRSLVPFYRHPLPKKITDTHYGLINTLGVPDDLRYGISVNVNLYSKSFDLVSMDKMVGDVIDALHDYNNGNLKIEFQWSRPYKGKKHISYNLRFIIYFKAKNSVCK